MALPGNKDFNDYDNYITDTNPTTSAQAQDYFRNQWELLGAVIDCDFWQPETVYQPGDVVKSDSMPNGTEAVMVATKASVTSNVEPQWGTVGSGNISDGACFWKLRWQHWSKDVEQITDLTTGATNRLPNTAYSVGNVVYDKSNLSVALKCTQAGTTSNTELDISGVSVGESVEDGSVVWEVVSRDVAIEMLKNIAKGIDIPTLTLAGNRTIADLRTALEEWLNANSFSCGAVKFGATPYFIEAWDNEDLTYSIPDASWWNVYSIGSYARAEYTHLLLVSYDAKNIYTLQKKGNVWGKIQKLAINDALSMPSVTRFITIANPSFTQNTATAQRFDDYFVAPCDGWLRGEFYGLGTSKHSVVIAYEWGTSIYIATWDIDASQSCIIPIAKGTSITIRLTHMNSISLGFYYAQSEV